MRPRLAIPAVMVAAALVLLAIDPRTGIVWLAISVALLTAKWAQWHYWPRLRFRVLPRRIAAATHRRALIVALLLWATISFVILAAISNPAWGILAAVCLAGPLIGGVYHHRGSNT